MGLKVNKLGHSSSRHVRRVLVLGHPRPRPVFYSICIEYHCCWKHGCFFPASIFFCCWVTHYIIYNERITTQTNESVQINMFGRGKAKEKKYRNVYRKTVNLHGSSRVGDRMRSLFIVRSQIQHLRNYCANLGTQADLFFVGWCERNATTTPKTCAWQCMQMTAFFPWPKKKWGKSALHWGKRLVSILRKDLERCCFVCGS